MTKAQQYPEIEQRVQAAHEWAQRQPLPFGRNMEDIPFLRSIGEVASYFDHDLMAALSFLAMENQMLREAMK
jgi:hypothetical protein